MSMAFLFDHATQSMIARHLCRATSVPQKTRLIYDLIHFRFEKFGVLLREAEQMRFAVCNDSNAAVL